MARDRCWRCKGKGEVADVRFPALAVLTLGLTWLVERSMPGTCDVCDGRGWLPDGA